MTPAPAVILPHLAPLTTVACPVCQGAGELAYSLSGHMNDPRTRTYQCDTCQGLGVIQGCPVCERAAELCECREVVS